VRTRYTKEIEDLKKIGANEVIPEEFETSVEIFSRVLNHYQMPSNVIHTQINNIRQDSYRVLRSTELPKKHLAERYDVLSKIDTEFYQIGKSSPVDGYSIKELRLRSETGATIITVQRGENIHTNPSPDFALQSGDIIMLIGKREDINRAIHYIESEKFTIDRYDR
jgi:CPA2 family monovalent cation:H+ antiporter-2